MNAMVEQAKDTRLHVGSHLNKESVCAYCQANYCAGICTESHSQMSSHEIGWEVRAWVLWLSMCAVWIVINATLLQVAGLLTILTTRMQKMAQSVHFQVQQVCSYTSSQWCIGVWKLMGLSNAFAASPDFIQTTHQSGDGMDLYDSCTHILTCTPAFVCHKVRQVLWQQEAWKSTYIFLDAFVLIFSLFKTR